MVNYTTEQIFDKIKESLEKKNPLSIIREGDGEARVLNGFKDVPALEFILKKLLGEVPSVHEIKEIRANLIEAYENASIIGIPVGKKLDKKDFFWHNSIKILFENADPQKLTLKEYVDMDFCYDFLLNGSYHKLFEGLETINYVSCRNLDEAFKRRYGIKNICSFHIAPERKFEPDYVGYKHYPVQFNEIRRWMRAAPLNGNLFIYGAGVAGKIYGQWAAEYGAVAVDIGSVFDAFAGRVTRGEKRGANSFDTTYKL